MINDMIVREILDLVEEYVEAQSNLDHTSGCDSDYKMVQHNVVFRRQMLETFLNSLKG